jgi:hypothetical protein
MSCKECESKNTKTHGLSRNFYKCNDCGYIGERPRKFKPKKEKVVYENSCADDYLDYLSSQ